MHRRRLFCELSPRCYALSVWKGILLRHLADLRPGLRFARRRAQGDLPCVVYRHASLIRRTLGGVDPQLQEGKAVNLSLAAPRIDGVVVRPGETFSLWRLVGRTCARKGYREGLMIRRGAPDRGIGGGLCQLSNLIHWMVLHTPLTVVERHHHDGVDLFPDCGRQVPFGVGTSISYNYLDYRFRNDTDTTFQLKVWCDATHLRGELRAAAPLAVRYHVVCEGESFAQEGDAWYRRNEVWRYRVDKATGVASARELVQRSHARVLYDPALIDPARRAPDV